MLGIIGGMSWESSAEYYRYINRGVAERLGGLNSADLILRSVNFEPLEKLQHQGDWTAIAQALSEAAVSLERAGAGALMLATNTMHKVAPIIEESISIPFLHIADAVGKRIRAANMKRVGLLGTAFTMEEDFYSVRLTDNFGLEVIIPSAAEREFIHRVIYRELCLGIFNPESQKRFLDIIDGLKARGASGVILGCTEIPLLITQEDSSMDVFDSTAIHCREAVEFLCASGEAAC